MASRFLVLNSRERDALLRPINGRGGFQDLMHRLQAQFRAGTSELRVTPDDIDDIQRYAFDGMHLITSKAVLRTGSRSSFYGTSVRPSGGDGSGSPHSDESNWRRGASNDVGLG